MNTIAEPARAPIFAAIRGVIFGSRFPNTTNIRWAISVFMKSPIMETIRNFHISLRVLDLVFFAETVFLNTKFLFHMKLFMTATVKDIALRYM